jgi:F0F1-type ATP synthase epsilon subunit
MEEFIELQIIRPTSKEIVNVEWIEIESPSGNFVVGAGHLPLISILKVRGRVIYKKAGTDKLKIVDSYGGFFKIQDDKATVILDL